MLTRKRHWNLFLKRMDQSLASRNLLPTNQCLGLDRPTSPHPLIPDDSKRCICIPQQYGLRATKIHAQSPVAPKVGFRFLVTKHIETIVRGSQMTPASPQLYPICSQLQREPIFPVHEEHAENGVPSTFQLSKWKDYLEQIELVDPPLHRATHAETFPRKPLDRQ